MQQISGVSKHLLLQNQRPFPQMDCFKVNCKCKLLEKFLFIRKL